MSQEPVEHFEDLLLSHTRPQPSWLHKQLVFALPDTVCQEALHPSFLPSLSQSFNDASHDGDSETAVRRGMLLFALYLTLYPPLYPQTGGFRLLVHLKLVQSYAGPQVYIV